MWHDWKIRYKNKIFPFRKLFCELVGRPEGTEDNNIENDVHVLDGNI
jgi:hypothetical protein